MVDWIKHKLSDTCASIDYGLTASASSIPVGPKFLRITDIVSPDLNWASVPFVSGDVPSPHRYKLHHGDIVIARTGATTGESRFINNPPDAVFASYLVRLTIKADYHPRYVAYWLKSPQFRDYLRGVLGDKSAQPNASASTMTNAPMTLPRDREYQVAVASVLGALDDKIDLNRRINETLEAMARAVFKDLFVDFGPTRAKMEGRAPYLAPEIWSLFPDRLDHETKPRGWAYTKLGDLCARVAMGPFGSDIKTENFVEFGVPVIRGGNLKNGFVDHDFVYVSEWKADQLRNANAFRGDIVITHRGTLGQVGIIPKNSCFPRYVASQSQMLLTADRKRTAPRFIFEFLRSERGMQQLLAFTSQTGVPAIARPSTSLKSVNIIDPTRPVLEEFEKLLNPIVDRESAIVSENRTLIAIRDLLLPKLMSGEIRVKDAEKVVEVVA